MATYTFIGRQVSVTSESDIRYEGTIVEINFAGKFIALANVRVYGTEDRRNDESAVKGTNKIYANVIFFPQDLKEMTILDQDLLPPVPLAINNFRAWLDQVPVEEEQQWYPYNDVPSATHIPAELAPSTVSRMHELVSQLASLKLEKTRSCEGSAEDLPFNRTASRSSEPAHVSAQEALLQCISLKLQFSHGWPVAAVITHRWLLHWKAFETERTDVFERVMQSIKAISEDREDMDTLSYCLATCSALLVLLQRTLKAEGLNSSRRLELFSSVSQTFQSPTQTQTQPAAKLAEQIVRQQVEAKYPALLFRQQLATHVVEVYGKIRDKTKEAIRPLLKQCILVTSHWPQWAPQTTQTLSFEWTSVLSVLSTVLSAVKTNHVPTFLPKKLFAQIFAFINVDLFNHCVLNKECCSFSNGTYVQRGLTKLEEWTQTTTVEYIGTSWDELRVIRQAIGFLVLSDKPEKSIHEITREVCPSLNAQQLYRLSVMYRDDSHHINTISPEVLSKLQRRNSKVAPNDGFFLHDDIDIPFHEDEINAAMPKFEHVDIVIPNSLLENSAFSFLKTKFEALGGFM